MRQKTLFQSLFVLSAIVGMASPALASRTVTSPTVTAGETVAEVKGEYVVDHRDSVNDAWKNKLVIGHGFTSFWYSEIETNLERGGAPGAQTDFTNIDWKNKFQFTRQKDSGIDTGLRLTYGKNTTGDDDRVEVKFLAGKDIGNTAHRANLILDRTVGPGKGMNWGLSWSSRYKWTDAVQPGFEIYDSFGRIGDEPRFDRQDHRAGPVFYGKINKNLSYDAGYLFGLSDRAPDGTVKVILKYKFDHSAK